METVLYVIWFLVPTSFFLLALWSKLEQMGGRAKRDNPGDLVKQGTFVLICVIGCVVIDKTVLPAVADSLLPGTIPLGFYQAILLPLVLLIAAKLMGGSRGVLIGAKHPNAGRSNHRAAKRR